MWIAERRWKETPTVPAVVPDQMFLGDPGVVYQNYAFTGYRNYDSLTGRPPWSNIYDPLGNFLISGRQLGTWTAEQSRQGDISSGDSELRANLRNFHGVLSMGGQTYSGWASNLIFTRGGSGPGSFWTKGIITRFTPLTLNRVSLHGLRGDLLSPFGDALTVIASYQYQGYTGGEDFHGGGDDSAILLAGHYERETGPLRLGATYANLHMFDARYPTTDLRGDLHSTQPIPALIAVRISDDSPNDGRGGPVVYGVQLVVNGQPRPNLIPDLVRRDLTNTFTTVGRTSITGTFRPSFYYEPSVGRTPGPYFGLEKPLYADYLYRRDHEQGQDVSGFADVDRLVRFIDIEDPSQVQRANGTEALVYYFNLEGLTHVRSVEVEASVGNDYRIEVADINVTNPNEDRYDSRYSAPFYKIVRRAEGNVQDLSNVERIRIPIGQETGLSVWGVNMALDLVGLRVRGEFAQSITYSRYQDGVPGDQLVFRGEYPVLRVPEANGERNHRRDRAGYVQLERETARYGFGGELFSIGPMFSQRLMKKPGEVGLGGGFPHLKNKTTFLSLLEDNDDGDANPENKVRGSAPRDLSVFPGQDADNDGIPDTNRNLNGLPDFLEPFLLYHVDPDEYVYGLDFNNNDVVDEREDDMKEDLPYDRDLQGAHGYVRWKPWTGAGATLGWLQSHEIAGGGRNDQRYLRMQYGGERPGVGEWLIENELKRVWDDVPNDVFSWTARNTSVDQPFGRADEGRFAYVPTFSFDPLNYRNSLANRLYISGTLKWLPGWRIVTRLKLEHNRQYGGTLRDGSEQAKDRIRTLALVQQADYTWHWGNLTLQPALKGLWLKRTRQQADRALDHTQTVVPIIMARYELSPVTELKAGLQGFPGWWFKETHLAEPRDSFKRRTATVFLSNMSDYSGYKISTNLGFKQDRLEYTDEFRFLESFDTTEIFVRLFLGYAQNVLY